MQKLQTAIVLVSGGMDSALAAAFAVKTYKPAFLHVNYGQRTEERELKAFHDIADYYNVEKRLVVDISYLRDIGGSSLTDKKIKVTKYNLAINFHRRGLGKPIPSSYVPFRNANILAIAVSWAEVLKAQKIFIGAVEEDSSGYPDCRKKFFLSFGRMIKLGTKPDTDIEIVTPVIDFSKRDIVLKSVELKSPLHLTWSCYKENKNACGVCDSCAIRIRGFRQAGIIDPITYK